MPPRPSPFAHIGLPDEADCVRALEDAVVSGRNDLGFLEEDAERIDSAIRLMALAQSRLVDVATAAHLVQAHLHSGTVNEHGEYLRRIASTLRNTVAGAIRLAWRALERHARDTGYDVAPWQAEAAYGAQAVVLAAVDPEPTNLPPEPLQETRDASRALAEALAAASEDRMAVPRHLADSLGHLIALWLLVARLLQPR